MCCAQDAVDKLYLKAHAAEVDEDYDRAIELWSEVLKLEPKDATAYFNRASAYKENEKFEKALADYGTAIQLNPNDPVAYEARAKICAQRCTWSIGDHNVDDEAAAKADYAMAIADYSVAIQLELKDKADPKAWLEKKAKPGAEGYNYAMDIACQSALIKLDPKILKLGLVGRGCTRT